MASVCLRSVPLSAVLRDEVDFFCLDRVDCDVVGNAAGKAVVDFPGQPAEAAVPQPQPKPAVAPPCNDAALPVLDGCKAAVLDCRVPAVGDGRCHVRAVQGEFVQQCIQGAGVHVGVDVQADGFVVGCCFHGHPSRKVV